MRFYEFASADDKLELWRVIDKSVWQTLDQQAPVPRARKNTAKPKARAPTKAEFQRRGTKIAAANAVDDIDPNSQAAIRLQQSKQGHTQKNY